MSKLTSALLPHLDRPHRHAPGFHRPPAGKPSAVGLPKVLHGRVTAVSPRLGAHSVSVGQVLAPGPVVSRVRSKENKAGDESNLREPALCSSDRHVENEIEFLVKGGVGSASLGPRVFWRRVVHSGPPEFTIRPHVLVLREVEEDDLL